MTQTCWPAWFGRSFILSLATPLLAAAYSFLACWVTPPLSVNGASAGTKAFTNAVGMRLVRIPGTNESFPGKGTFAMGSPIGEAFRDADEEQHEVEVSELFLGAHEVTQRQFRKVMGYNPSYFSNDARARPGAAYVVEPEGGSVMVGAENTGGYPVENVSWEEAAEFCAKLNKLEDQGKPAGWVYRLPREAEWEYACRGGATTYEVFHFGDSLSSSLANFDGNFPAGEAKVGDYRACTTKTGSYKPNRFGLHDMHGNVWEWCADWYGSDYYARGSKRDPDGPEAGWYKVIRGGGWIALGHLCRSAYRDGGAVSSRNFNVGFRVALVPPGRGRMR